MSSLLHVRLTDTSAGQPVHVLAHIPKNVVYATLIIKVKKFFFCICIFSIQYCTFLMIIISFQFVSNNLIWGILYTDVYNYGLFLLLSILYVIQYIIAIVWIMHQLGVTTYHKTLAVTSKITFSLWIFLKCDIRKVLYYRLDNER